MKCGKCAGAPAVDMSGCFDTWYCSRGCQKLHWTKGTHKAECNKLFKRKLLVRAAELVQAVWRVIRMRLYDRTVLQVAYTEDMIIILEDSDAPLQPPLFKAFSMNKTEGMTDEARDVMLFVDKHQESHVWLSRLVTRLLKGSAFQCERYAVFSANSSRPHQ